MHSLMSNESLNLSYNYYYKLTSILIIGPQLLSFNHSPYRTRIYLQAYFSCSPLKFTFNEFEHNKSITVWLRSMYCN